MKPATPDREARRLAIERYAILDTPPEPAFDELVEIAAGACGTPIALVTLLDRDRQWHKAERGLGLRELPIEESVCEFAVRQNEVFVVEDLRSDPRFRDNPLVTAGPRMRFYAGAPIVTPEGTAIGAVCVIDREPRQLAPEKREVLQVLARQAVSQLELRRALVELGEARRAAQRSERFLRETIDALTGHIAIIDAQGTIAYVNRAWQEFARANAEPVALPGLGPGTSYLAECTRAAARGDRQAETVGEAIRAALAGTAQPFEIEYPCHSPDEQRWFIARVSAFAIDDARYAVVAHQNITGRVRAEHEVARLQEERFRSIFDTAAIGFALVDADGAIRQTNPAFCRIAGRDAAALHASRVQEIAHPEDAGELVRLRARVLAGELPGALVELRLLRPGGEQVWVHWSIAALGTGEGAPTQTIAAVQNITRRRRAERERDRFFRLSIDLFAIVGFDGTIRRVNPAGTRILGFEERELLGRRYDELVHPADRAAARGELERLAQGRSNGYLDLRMRTRDGGERHLRWSAAPWTEESLIVAVGRDITEYKETEARERRALAQLRALAGRLQSVREEERAAMSREIHDELGQTLTALKMDLTLLARDARGPLAEELRGVAALVDKTLDSARRLARQLRPEALDTLGLAAAIESHAAEFQARSGVRCMVEAGAELDELPMEKATALFRIVQEALTNVARHAQACKVRIRAGAGDGRVVLEVHDDGRGIAADAADASGSLGLLGMRERAAMLGGSFEVFSPPGGGTLVRASLPRGEP